MDRLRESQKRSYDREATSRSFNVGDLVMVANDIPKMNTNHKLTWKWIGPFAIIKMNTPLTASIKKTTTSRPLMVNVNRLKHYHSMEMPLSNVFNGYPSHVDDENDELGNIPKAVKVEPTATPPPTPVTPIDPPSDDESSFHSPPSTLPSSPFARTSVGVIRHLPLLTLLNPLHRNPLRQHIKRQQQLRLINRRLLWILLILTLEIPQVLLNDPLVQRIQMFAILICPNSPTEVPLWLAA